MEKIRAVQVSAKALKTRKKFLGALPHQPICPYALGEAMGFDIRFVNIPSFEGMYVADQNLILISSDRPEGRKRFTCAHEIGHHVLEHGTIIDEIITSGSNKQEEQEADYFASLLLMPPSAISRAFQSYDIKPEQLTGMDAYSLSKYFGASYEGFVTHIHFNLKLITYRKYQELKREDLSGIRKAICGDPKVSQTIWVGSWWVEKAIDIEVGDVVVSDTSLNIDGPEIIYSLRLNEKYLYKATKPGITRLGNDQWSSFVKVSRSKFHGFLQYKYDEDDE